MMQNAIADLVCYGLTTGLIESEDRIYTANRILALLKADALDEGAEEKIRTYSGEGSRDSELIGRLSGILAVLCDAAVEKGIIETDSVTYRDLFDTELMAVMTERPSAVAAKFEALRAENGVKATDWYYTFSCDTNYIRRDRIAKDMKWVTPTEYGDLDITINLSKPEKDPKAIAAALTSAQTAYPKCQLCTENTGYAGRVNHPARGSHRPLPITVTGQKWYFQYSPYVYYNEHCIVFNSEHTPMKIDRSAFAKLLDIVGQFPHYFVGSNADLPIVGGSILTHEHFQGGHYEFAMAKAPVEKKVSFKGFEDIEAGIVKWPMSVIRLDGSDPDRLVELADKILLAWRGYTDEEAFIFAETEGTPHNTITPIARRRGDAYELDLVLRNNITTEEHPMGVYHPHAALHHIKKENIGLIEVMGLAVLPARLKGELQQLREFVLAGKDLRADETLEKHADWMDEIRSRYEKIDETNIDRILEDEVGKVFAQCLECAGVYKRTPEGAAAFERFIESVR